MATLVYKPFIINQAPLIEDLARPDKSIAQHVLAHEIGLNPLKLAIGETVGRG